MRFVKSKSSQKLFMLVFFGPKLKSLMIIWFSWLGEYKTRLLSKFSRWPLRLFLFDYQKSKAIIYFPEVNFCIKGFHWILFYGQKFRGDILSNKQHYATSFDDSITWFTKSEINLLEKVYLILLPISWVCQYIL